MKRTVMQSAVGLLVLLSLSMPGHASSDVVGVRSLQRWQGPGEELATTLSVTEYSCAQRSQRVFVELPGSARWLLEAVTSPGEGEIRLSLRHAESGWHLELVEDFETSIEVPTPNAFGDVLFWLEVAEGEAVPRKRYLLLNGETRLSSSGSGHFMVKEALANSFTISQVQSLLEAEAPAAVRSDLGALVSLMDAPPAVRGVFLPFAGLNELLAKSLPEARKGAESPAVRPRWNRIDTRAFGGTEAEQRGALTSARQGREEIRRFHDEGVTDAYETGDEGHSEAD